MNILLETLRNEPSMDFIFDYKNEIKNIDDIIAIKPANFHIDAFFENDELTLSIIGDTMLTQPCAKTLKPVDVNIHVKTTLILSRNEDADYMLEDEIDLRSILFGTIIAEKPYVVYHPDAKDVSFDKEKRPHPAFADLDKLFEK